MDQLQQLLQHPLVSSLQESTTSTLSTNLSILRKTVIDPYIITPLSTILYKTTGTNDLFSLLLLLVLLYISLRVLDYARRIIMWWVFFAIRLIFWASVVSFALYVYRVGFQKAGQDLGWVFGIVEGFVGDFQARASEAAAAAAAGGASSGSGAGSGYRDIPGWDSKRGQRAGAGKKWAW